MQHLNLDRRCTEIVNLICYRSGLKRSDDFFPCDPPLTSDLLPTGRPLLDLARGLPLLNLTAVTVSSLTFLAREAGADRDLISFTMRT